MFSNSNVTISKPNFGKGGQRVDIINSRRGQAPWDIARRRVWRPAVSRYEYEKPRPAAATVGNYGQLSPDPKSDWSRLVCLSRSSRASSGMDALQRIAPGIRGRASAGFLQAQNTPRQSRGVGGTGAPICHGQQHGKTRGICYNRIFKANRRPTAPLVWTGNARSRARAVWTPSCRANAPPACTSDV